MKTLIFEPSNENLIKCSHALKASEIVAMPTETVYGLAANCFDEIAIEKVFKSKNRPTFDPLIVHVNTNEINHSSKFPNLDYLFSLNLISINQINDSLKQTYETLMKTFWPGPLTIIFPKSILVPDLVTSGLQTVAIRAPKHEVAQNLIKLANSPLCAPSANRFGRISPTKASDVYEELNGSIPYIIDGGECEIGLESTVVSVSEQSIHILRPGAITSEILHNATGLQIIERTNNSPTLNAPGMLETHYAPRKPLLLFNENQLNKEMIIKSIEQLKKIDPKNKITKCSLLLNNDSSKNKWLSILPLSILDIFYLNSNENTETAAKQFFETLRKADHSNSDCIIAEQFSIDLGIGHAIRDRLQKASTKL